MSNVVRALMTCIGGDVSEKRGQRNQLIWKDDIYGNNFIWIQTWTMKGSSHKYFNEAFNLRGTVSKTLMPGERALKRKEDKRGWQDDTRKGEWEGGSHDYWMHSVEQREGDKQFKSE